MAAVKIGIEVYIKMLFIRGWKLGLDQNKHLIVDVVYLCKYMHGCELVCVCHMTFCIRIF